MILAQKYKQEILRMLLMRKLGREDDEDAILERLDEIWLVMSAEEHKAVDLWGKNLPETLRTDGPDVESDWDRAGGDVECSVCGLTYYRHPIDPRETAFEMHVGCDGKRWKL